MKLVGKVAASVASLALLAMVGDAWLGQRQRDELVRMDVVKDWRMARVLRANVEALWQKSGEEDARFVVETTDDAVPNRMIRYVRLVGLEPVDLPKDVPWPSDLRDELPWARQRQDVAWRYLPDGNGDQMRYLYIPLAPDGTVRAVIVAGESMAPIDAHLRGNLLRTAALGSSVIGLSGLLALLLGAWLVDRPVEGLRHALRALGEGELPPPPKPGRRDELGALAHELHAVGTRLVEKERLRHADRLRTIGQLAAGVAHQIGTPLSVVRLRAGMIASGEATADEAKDYGRIIVEQVDRVSVLVRQLLNYSRRQGGQATLVDVRPLVAMSLDMLRPLAERAGVSLASSRPAEPAVVRADAIQLEQVVTNLVMNAVQAVESEGTVRVEVGRGAARRAGISAAGREEVWLRVEDDGPGIPPEHLPHVFEPFYTTKPVGEGSGLGLAVVQAIVEEQGGRVEVQSDPGVGTRFTVYLPAADEGSD